MAAKWSVSGNYFETCNCDYLCPCLSTNFAAKPTQGDCRVAFAFQVNKGSFDGVSLDGVNFVVVAIAPGPMIEGNWTVGLIVDDKTDEKQQQAVLGIASGQAGGPMANLAPLIGKFAGMEAKPITFKQNGKSWSVSVPGMVEQSAEPVLSGVKPDEPMYLDNTMHPVNPRMGLAKSTNTHFDAFGVKYDSKGGNNGHVATFSWSA